MLVVELWKLASQTTYFKIKFLQLDVSQTGTSRPGKLQRSFDENTLACFDNIKVCISIFLFFKKIFCVTILYKVFIFCM